MTHQISIGRESAIALYDSGWWKDKTAKEIVDFQLFTSELSVPFDIFHKAIEQCLGRPVWTHEFAYQENLVKELLGDRPAQSLEQIIGLIPEEKRVLVLVDAIDRKEGK